MKKLTLDVEELTVDSFDTSLCAPDEGTVRGYSGGWSCDSICPTVSDPERCCGRTLPP